MEAKPSHTGPIARAYTGTRPNGSEYLAVCIPGLKTVYLTKVPDDRRNGERSPVYSGQAGAAFLNQKSDGTGTYLNVKLNALEKTVPLFACEDGRGGSLGPPLPVA